ncbi:3-hydroxyacyl-CoA dehydrogenase family protein [Blastococcus haudaquaticus]|uniref:3-hydroxybutyryl-CoA dehydrogenase n=1 Tax=Blastococcus haudaquaticus TaxID=1938745 RepID=A0A286GR31_9ACTN|nr:3-hydroxyacyl-CoA dehydrogenase NAD-binding domain-containing protein [Blastococcus haudaquaticus]SOD97980.1 3-hydroxybutyryl-CoA dehydrogenase [Blastococcus haudaquaticus]
MPDTAQRGAPPDQDALRVMSGLLSDATLLAARGTAAPQDIDTAMRLGAGHPVGPFELLATNGPEDLSGLALPAGSARSPGSAGDEIPTGSDISPTVAWTGPVGVVGTGHMAGGIVEAVARSGRAVRVLARTDEAGQRLRARLASSLGRAVSRGRLDEATRDTIAGRLSLTLDPSDLAVTDVVIEAVAEDLDVKAAVVSRLDAALPVSVPLATNTSSFRVSDLQPFIAGPRPVLALHFFNPAQVMKLVEVVVPDDVEDAEGLQAAATAWARGIGKTPIRCADSRGFVVNRLLIPFLNDAVRLHESGVPVEEVDALLVQGAGHPMGPLALIDLIGLDVTVAALESMAAVEDDPRLSPARTLHELVAAGRLGRKTGAGFHSYQEK